MGQKVHRKRRTYYRRPSHNRFPIVKVLCWVLAAAVLIPGSFFAAKWIDSKQTDLPTAQTDVGESVTTGGTTTATTTAPPAMTAQTVFRGFSVSHTALTDLTALQATAEKAAADGFNYAVIELKAKSGQLYYISETAVGKQAAASAADALTLSALTDAFAVLRTAGITPMPLLYAFEDAVASRNLPDAKVTVDGHTDWTWYDGDPQKGGRAWLNPYTDAAQAYIATLAEELQTAGAGALMLDGVYFPTQTSQAHFAVGADAKLSKGEVLGRFMTRMDAVCDVPLLLRSSANAVLGYNTAGYHVNPLDIAVDAMVADMRAEMLGTKFAVNQQVYTVSDTTISEIVARVSDLLADRVDAMPAENRPATAFVVGGSQTQAQLQALLQQDANTSYFVF